jgi:hypothetical protein
MVLILVDFVDNYEGATNIILSWSMVDIILEEMSRIWMEAYRVGSYLTMRLARTWSLET